VRVQAKASGNSLEFTVQDNGQGFNLAARPGGAKGHGLGNMRRRADAMGGTLSLQSSTGNGTTVALHVKLPTATETRMTNDQ
jgi:signal transduction histidine kinase